MCMLIDYPRTAFFFGCNNKLIEVSHRPASGRPTSRRPYRFSRGSAVISPPYLAGSTLSDVTATNMAILHVHFKSIPSGCSEKDCGLVG